jgi:phospholipase C
VNAIEQSPFWRDTAIVITYDDSDGLYDHVAAPIVNQSIDGSNDAIFGKPKSGTGSCASPTTLALPTGTLNDRCGLGVREAFPVISPFAKANYVDHGLKRRQLHTAFHRVRDPQSFDVLASGSIPGMFDFDDFHGDDRSADTRRLILEPSSGKPVGYYARAY